MPCSSCPSHAPAAAAAVSAKNDRASLPRKLTGSRTQVESFHAAIERLAREPQALRGTADIAARFAQASLDELPARLLRLGTSGDLTAPRDRIGRAALRLGVRHRAMRR